MKKYVRSRKRKGDCFMHGAYGICIGKQYRKTICRNGKNIRLYYYIVAYNDDVDDFSSWRPATGRPYAILRVLPSQVEILDDDWINSKEAFLLRIRKQNGFPLPSDDQLKKK